MPGPPNSSAPPVPTRLGPLHVQPVGAGPPAVLWHSLFVDSTTWRRMERELGASRRLVIIDGPGHGWSADAGRDYTLEDCAAAAARRPRAGGNHRPGGLARKRLGRARRCRVRRVPPGAVSKPGCCLRPRPCLGAGGTAPDARQHPRLPDPGADPPLRPDAHPRRAAEPPPGTRGRARGGRRIPARRPPGDGPSDDLRLPATRRPHADAARGDRADPHDRRRGRPAVAARAGAGSCPRHAPGSRDHRSRGRPRGAVAPVRSLARADRHRLLAGSPRSPRREPRAAGDNRDVCRLTVLGAHLWSLTSQLGGDRPVFPAPGRPRRRRTPPAPATASRPAVPRAVGDGGLAAFPR